MTSWAKNIQLQSLEFDLFPMISHLLVWLFSMISHLLAIIMIIYANLCMNSSVLVIWNQINVNFENTDDHRETWDSLKRSCGRGLSEKYYYNAWKSLKTEIIRPVIRTISFYNIEIAHQFCGSVFVPFLAKNFRISFSRNLLNYSTWNLKISR